MRSPAYLVQPNIQRLPNLLRDVQEGEIRVPRFQRPFVWTTEQRLKLLESIYQGMPIGSILLWRTRDHDLQCYEKIGPLRLAWAIRNEPTEAKQIRQYVLDGHQRLTTLFAALGEGLISGEQINPSETPTSSEDDGEGAWPIFFDLEQKVFLVQARRGEASSTWLPLSILLDPFRLYEFQKGLLEAGADRALANRAEALASTFKDYSIPVVPIVTESLEVATESFQRVNSGGTSMNEVHMVSALTWTPDFDLNERIHEIRIELGEVGWENLEDQMILNTCKAVVDLNIYNAEPKEMREALRQNPEVLSQATEALKLAARFLRAQCKVYGPATLPYSYQIVLLADALRLATEDGEPAPEIVAAVEAWFWLTTYTEYFAGISAGRLAAAQQHLRKLAVCGENTFPPGLVPVVTAPRRFDFRSARSRAVALRMADLQLTATPNIPDPHQLLADHGREAVPMLIPSREVDNRLAERPENRILVHPKDASKMRRSLREPLLLSLFTDEPDLGHQSLLDSLAIDEEAATALKRGNFALFLKLRRRKLIEVERIFVERFGLRYELERL